MGDGDESLIWALLLFTVRLCVRFSPNRLLSAGIFSSIVRVCFPTRWRTRANMWEESKSRGFLLVSWAERSDRKQVMQSSYSLRRLTNSPLGSEQTEILHRSPLMFDLITGRKSRVSQRDDAFPFKGATGTNWLQTASTWKTMTEGKRSFIGNVKQSGPDPSAVSAGSDSASRLFTKLVLIFHFNCKCHVLFDKLSHEDFQLNKPTSSFCHRHAHCWFYTFLF